MDDPMEDPSGSDDDEVINSLSHENDPDLSTILRYLIRRGHIRFLSFDGGSDEESDDGSNEDDSSYVRNLRSGKKHGTPKGDPHPDTSLIDMSDLKQILLHQTGMSASCSQSMKTCPNTSSSQRLAVKTVPSFMPAVLSNREIGDHKVKNTHNTHVFSAASRCNLSSRFLPSKNASKVIEHYPSKAFCGFYSKSGDIFLSACQDTNIRIYDTQKTQFKQMKTVWARDVGWSVLDTDISPDSRHFIYSSWSECIHICNIYGDSESHEALTLAADDRRFCIFSLRFSHDGREILGGANDECLYVYDREGQSSILKIRCHEDDVNSVAFADSSSNILFSGGDDGLCKVWDRRALNESKPKPVGVLAGHVDGITYIDPKGDGRHLITNCKDQTIKLWDVRSFSPSQATEATRKAVSKQNWDYRWQAIPRKLLSNRRKLEGDTSLMTYLGHSVLQTLIRCHFSPQYSTGQRYIYTGCSTGRVVVYDVLTGKIVRMLHGHKGCVRDVSWHPYEPHLMSTSWDGTVMKWDYMDENAYSSDDDEMDYDDDDDDNGKSQDKPRRSERLAEKRKRTMSLIEIE